MSTTTKHQVGNAEIFRITELGFSAAPQTFYEKWSNDTPVPQDWTSSDVILPNGEFGQSIHFWLIKESGRISLIDSGVGNNKQRPALPFLSDMNLPILERLAELGVRPEDVNFVLMTHVHIDHVGWNTVLRDGSWQPTFPNAQYVFSAVEKSYFENSKPGNFNFEANLPAYQDSLVPIIEAGLSKEVVVDGSEAIPGFAFMPTPGHSADHASILFTSNGKQALFTGDIMHHPIQVYRPDWNSIYCEFGDNALASRKWALEFAAENNIPMFTAHFPSSSVGSVSKQGGGYAWQFL